MKSIFAAATAAVFLVACQQSAPNATVTLPQEVEVVDETVVVEETVTEDVAFEKPVVGEIPL